MIFGGLATVYSTCPVCDQSMMVTTEGDHAHPCCNPDVRPVSWEPPTLVGAAVQYAGWGWPVFPLSRGSKKPLAGSHGFLDASTDSATVHGWWDPHPQNNIGLATGHLFDVIDIDPAAGGSESLTKLLAAHRIPACHGVAKSGSGGLHLYIALRRSKNGVAILPGVDYRGLGGYVAAAPSIRRGVGEYSWVVAPSPNIKAGHGSR